MKAGRLNHRVIVESPTEVRGASGGMTRTWTLVATVWGAVEPVRGREHLTADQIIANMDTMIRIRYAPIIASINATWRLRLGATIYNIASIANVNMRNRELEIMCLSGVNDG